MIHLNYTHPDFDWRQEIACLLPLNDRVPIELIASDLGMDVSEVRRQVARHKGIQSDRKSVWLSFKARQTVYDDARRYYRKVYEERHDGKEGQRKDEEESIFKGKKVRKRKKGFAFG